MLCNAFFLIPQYVHFDTRRDLQQTFWYVPKWKKTKQKQNRGHQEAGLVEAKQTRVQGWRSKSVKGRQKTDKGIVQGTRRPEQRQKKQKNKTKKTKQEIPGVEGFCFSTGQASVHRQRIRPWQALEMRQQWISTSLPFASERSVERRCPPAAPLLQQGLGLERRFWAVPPLALPAHFGPAAKEGERAQRKQSRKRDHKVTERVRSCSRKRYEIHMEFARGEAFEGSPVAKKEGEKKWIKITEFGSRGRGRERSHEL